MSLPVGDAVYYFIFISADYDLSDNVDAVFQQFYRAAEKAVDLNIGLNAGHDLNLNNLTHFATLPQLLEVSIGHAMTVDAIEMGLANAIRAYQKCLGKQ